MGAKEFMTAEEKVKEVIARGYFGGAYALAVSLQSELDTLKARMKEIGERSENPIPYYAYGDNEAACRMADDLKHIHSLATKEDSNHA